MDDLIDKMIQNPELNAIEVRIFMIQKVCTIFKQIMNLFVQVFEKFDMKQITDKGVIRKLCEIVIKDNPKLVRRCKNGKKNELQKLIHKTFELSHKKANIPLIVDSLTDLLELQGSD